MSTLLKEVTLNPKLDYCKLKIITKKGKKIYHYRFYIICKL